MFFITVPFIIFLAIAVSLTLLIPFLIDLYKRRKIEKNLKEETQATELNQLSDCDELKDKRAKAYAKLLSPQLKIFRAFLLFAGSIALQILFVKYPVVLMGFSPAMISFTAFFFALIAALLIVWVIWHIQVAIDARMRFKKKLSVLQIEASTFKHSYFYRRPQKNFGGILIGAAKSAMRGVKKTFNFIRGGVKGNKGALVAAVTNAATNKDETIALQELEVEVKEEIINGDALDVAFVAKQLNENTPWDNLKESKDDTSKSSRSEISQKLFNRMYEEHLANDPDSIHDRIVINGVKKAPENSVDTLFHLFVILGDGKGFMFHLFQYYLGHHEKHARRREEFEKAIFLAKEYLEQTGGHWTQQTSLEGRWRLEQFIFILKGLLAFEEKKGALNVDLYERKYRYKNWTHKSDDNNKVLKEDLRKISNDYELFFQLMNCQLKDGTNSNDIKGYLTRLNNNVLGKEIPDYVKFISRLFNLIILSWGRPSLRGYEYCVAGESDENIVKHFAKLCEIAANLRGVFNDSDNAQARTALKLLGGEFPTVVQTNIFKILDPAPSPSLQPTVTDGSQWIDNPNNHKAMLVVLSELIRWSYDQSSSGDNLRKYYEKYFLLYYKRILSCKQANPYFRRSKKEPLGFFLHYIVIEQEFPFAAVESMIRQYFSIVGSEESKKIDVKFIIDKLLRFDKLNHMTFTSIDRISRIIELCYEHGWLKQKDCSDYWSLLIKKYNEILLTDNDIITGERKKEILPAFAGLIVNLCTFSPSQTKNKGKLGIVESSESKENKEEEHKHKKEEQVRLANRKEKELKIISNYINNEYSNNGLFKLKRRKGKAKDLKDSIEDNYKKYELIKTLKFCENVGIDTGFINHIEKVFLQVIDSKEEKFSFSKIQQYLTNNNVKTKDLWPVQLLYIDLYQKFLKENETSNLFNLKKSPLRDNRDNRDNMFLAFFSRIEKVEKISLVAANVSEKKEEERVDFSPFTFAVKHAACWENDGPLREAIAALKQNKDAYKHFTNYINFRDLKVILAALGNNKFQDLRKDLIFIWTSGQQQDFWRYWLKRRYRSWGGENEENKNNADDQSELSKENLLKHWGELGYTDKTDLLFIFGEVEKLFDSEEKAISEQPTFLEYLIEKGHNALLFNIVSDLGGYSWYSSSCLDRKKGREILEKCFDEIMKISNFRERNGHLHSWFLRLCEREDKCFLEKIIQINPDEKTDGVSASNNNNNTDEEKSDPIIAFNDWRERLKEREGIYPLQCKYIEKWVTTEAKNKEEKSPTGNYPIDPNGTDSFCYFRPKWLLQNFKQFYPKSKCLLDNFIVSLKGCSMEKDVLSHYASFKEGCSSELEEKEKQEKQEKQGKGKAVILKRKITKKITKDPAKQAFGNAIEYALDMTLHFILLQNFKKTFSILSKMWVSNSQCKNDWGKVLLDKVLKRKEDLSGHSPLMYALFHLQEKPLGWLYEFIEEHAEKGYISIEQIKELIKQLQLVSSTLKTYKKVQENNESQKNVLGQIEKFNKIIGCYKNKLTLVQVLCYKYSTVSDKMLGAAKTAANGLIGGLSRPVKWLLEQNEKTIKDKMDVYAHGQKQSLAKINGVNDASEFLDKLTEKFDVELDEKIASEQREMTPFRYGILHLPKKKLEQLFRFVSENKDNGLEFIGGEIQDLNKLWKNTSCTLVPAACRGNLNFAESLLDQLKKEEIKRIKLKKKKEKVVKEMKKGVRKGVRKGMERAKELRRIGKDMFKTAGEHLFGVKSRKEKKGLVADDSISDMSNGKKDSGQYAASYLQAYRHAETALPQNNNNINNYNCNYNEQVIPEIQTPQGKESFDSSLDDDAEYYDYKTKQYKLVSNENDNNVKIDTDQYWGYN